MAFVILILKTGQQTTEKETLTFFPEKMDNKVFLPVVFN